MRIAAQRPEIAIRSAVVPLITRHVAGPKRIDVRENDLVIVCIVRDGMPWIDAFLDHYRRLGARHIVFVENDSRDATLAKLRDAGDDVSVFTTSASFRHWQVALRRWLVRRFAGGGWALVCDIDELFDYPGSPRLPLRSMLRYLNEHRYTGVAVHMLDLFSPESPFDSTDGDVRRACRFYDPTALLWERFEDLESPRDFRIDVPDPNVRFCSNGVQHVAFGFVIPQTKVVMLRPSRGARIVNAHFSTDVRVADVSAVFYHLKFANGYLERLDLAIERQNYWAKSAIPRKIRAALERDPSIRFMSATARELTSGAGQLLDDGFLYASERYRTWMTATD